MKKAGAAAANRFTFRARPRLRPPTVSNLRPMTKRQSQNGAAAARGRNETACWSCRGPVDVRALFCHTCGKILPCRELDPFLRLGLKPDYDLDPAELERQYIGFQRRFHPDRFATQTAREKAYSLSHATAVNDAYEALKSPLSRARRLLEMRGHPVHDAAETMAHPELLASVMEMREALAGAEGGTELAAIAAEFEASLAGCVAALATAFATGGLDSAADLTVRLSFLEKLAGEARARARAATA